MKITKFGVVAVASLLCGALAFAGEAGAAKKGGAQSEKEKALANPYPNDYGPEKLTDEELKDYPADKKAGYELLLNKCAQCHTPARPLNSRFVEPDAGNVTPADRDSKEEAALGKLKDGNKAALAGRAFGDKSDGIWQIQASVWNRYVKRMLSKPGCGKDAGGTMTKDDAKKIYEFLVYDGQRRKLGANADKWKAHREKLISELKDKKPARYEELKKDNDL